MSTAEAVQSSAKGLSVRDYIDALVNIIRSPAGFYAETRQEEGYRKPATFLCISAVFFATVSMSYFYDNSATMGFIYFANALFMPILAASFTFILVGMTPGTRATFPQIFSVYAYASGAVMVVSWIPALGTVFELLRAALVTVGLVKACGLGWIRSLCCVALTAILLLCFFWSLAPVLIDIKNMLSAF